MSENISVPSRRNLDKHLNTDSKVIHKTMIRLVMTYRTETYAGTLKQTDTFA